MEIRKILPYCFWKFLIVLALAVTCHGGSFAQYQQIPPPGEPNPPTMKEYMQHVMDSYAPQLENLTEVELANSDKSFKSFLKWRTAMEHRVHPEGTLLDYILMKQEYATNLKSSYESAGNWHELGPYSKPAGNDNIGGCHSCGGGRNGIGPVSWISFDPNFATTQLMFTGGWSSGLWFSEDGGETWQNGGTDQLPPPISTADGISSHTDEDIWFITTGDGRGSKNKPGTRSTGLFRTTDRGQNWDMIGAPWDFGGATEPGGWNYYYWELRKLLLNPETGNSALQLFVTDYNGVYRTNNALGNVNASSPTLTDNMEWERVFDYNDVPTSYVIDGITYTLADYDPSNTGEQHIEIYAYDLTWGYDNSGIDTDKLIMSCSPVYKDSNDNERQISFVYVSNDQGNTWIMINLAATPVGYYDLRRLALRTTPANPELLFVHGSYPGGSDCVGGSNGRICSYNFNTNTWINNLDFSNNGDGDLVWGGKEPAFAISPNDEEESYVTQSIHLQYTGDGGESFQIICGAGNFHVDIEDIEYSPDGSQVWLATHGGPFVYDIATAVWQDKMDGIGNAEVLGFSSSKTNPDRLLIGTYHDGSIYGSGITGPDWVPDWKTVRGGDGQECLIDSENPDISYVTTQGASPKKNVDGWSNTSVSSVNPPAGSYSWYVNLEQNPFNSSSIYVAKTDLWRHDNRGDAGSPWFNLTNITSGDFDIGTKEYDRVYLNFPSDVDENLVFSLALGIDNQVGGATNTRDLFGCNKAMGSASEAQNSWFRIPQPISGLDLWFSSVVSDPDDHNIFYALAGYAPLNGSTGLSHKVAKYIYNGDNLLLDSPATIEAEGFTIEDLTFDFPNLSASKLVVIPGSRDFFVATDMGVFYSNEELMAANEEVWLAYGENFPFCSINRMEVNYASNKVRVATVGRGVWENDLPCDKLNTPIEITDDETWDDFRRYRNDIHVLAGATLTITGVVQMAAQTIIQVEPNATLIVNGGEITAACDGMWRGIEVIGNPDAMQYPNMQGRVFMKNGGSVENAEYGVSLGKYAESAPPDYSTSGGYIVCSTGAKFINCKTAVRAIPYNFSGYNLTKFHDTTFEINDELKSGQNPSNQVYLSGVGKIVFQNCIFRNTRTDYFPILHAGRGIHASNSDIKVKNCTFEDLYWGVSARSISLGDIEITGSDFKRNFEGVHLRNTGLVEVVQNNFEIPMASELNLDGAATIVPRGMYMAACTGYEVEENSYEGTGFGENVGIAIMASGDVHNEIYRNEFNNLEAGIVAMRDNRGPGIYDGLVFKCNKLGSGSEPLNYSIALTNKGEVQHYQGVLGVDDGGAGNVFLPLCPPFTTENEFYVGDDTPPVSSVLYIPFADDETRPDCNTSTMVAVPVSPYEFIYENHCPSNLSSGGVLGEHNGKYELNQDIMSGLYDVYSNIVNGGDTKFLLDLIDDPFVSSFDLRNELLLASPRVTDQVMIEAINRDPEMNQWHLAQVLLANSPLTQRVMNTLAHSDVTSYYRELVEDGQNGGMTNTTLMEMELSHFGGLMEAARADYLRQAIRQDSLLVLNDSIIHYLSDGASGEQLKMLMAYHLKRKQWQKAEDLLNEAPNMRWSNDYVGVMTVALDALQNTIRPDSIVARHQGRLMDVASKSTTEAFLAQSLLETYGLAEFEHDIVLPGMRYKSLEKDKLKKERNPNSIASVHPNPAKNAVYLNWRLPEEIIAEKVELVVYNAQGVRLYSQRLNGQVGIQEINISQWASGLYIYQLQHEQIKLHNEKFEVFK